MSRRHRGGRAAAPSATGPSAASLGAWVMADLAVESAASWRQPYDDPAGLASLVDEPVVQAVAAALPELDPVGHDADAAPVRRARHVPAVVVRRERGRAGLERRAVG